MSNAPRAVSPLPPARAARPVAERVAQAVMYELIGILVVSPALALGAGLSIDDSLTTLAALSLVAIAWTGLYNEWFDRLDVRLGRRGGGDRSHQRRWVHAIGLEASLTLVTWPLIIAMTGFAWHDALLADIGLGAAYVVYGYAYHLAFDRVRPLPDGVTAPAHEDASGWGNKGVVLGDHARQG